MSAPAPPHSAGTVMPMKPSRPISASRLRGISPARSQARTCGRTCSRAKARAVSRIRICSSPSSMGASRSAPGEQARALALPVAVLDRLALVVRLLAGGQRDLDLGAALLVEIDLQRHDGAALAL